MPAILKPKLIAIAVAVALFVTLAAYLKGRGTGASAARQADRLERLEQTYATREKQNEIRNNRPDDRQLVERLRAGAF